MSGVNKLHFIKRVHLNSIRAKIFILFIIISIIPILILTSINYINSVSTLKDEISKANKALLVQTGENLDNTLGMIEDKMWSFVILNMQANNKYVEGLGAYTANDPGQALDNIKGAIDIIQSFADTNKYIDSIYLYSLSDKYLVTSKRTQKKLDKIEDYDWYRKAKEGKGKLVWITTRNAYDLDARLEKMMISASLLIRDNKGTDIGILCVNLKNEIINDITTKINIGKTGFLLMCDNSGYIINHRNKDFISRNLGDEAYIRRMLENETGYFESNLDNNNYLITYFTSNYTKWKFATAVPEREITKNIYGKAQISIILCLICVILAVVFSFFISKNLYTPIKTLKLAMKKAAEGDFNSRIEDMRKDEFSVLNKSFNSMVENIDNIIRELYETRLLKKEAELKALQAQINPHFLYNTLDSMYWMSKLNKTQELSTMITSLSKYLKINLSKGRDIISVEEVIEEINCYFNIQKFRFGDKFDTVIDVEQDLYQYSIIKFLMQPLVENAIFHGIERKKGKGLIRVVGRKEGEYAVFQIMDDGVGINAERLEFVRESIEKGLEDRNFALINVSKRIKTTYGDNYRLEIESEEGKGTAIKIVIPLIRYENTAMRCLKDV